MATCAPSYAFINGELSGVGCSAYSHIKQAGGVPALLPFDINQLKASLRLLLHLFSSVARTVSAAGSPPPLLSHPSCCFKSLYFHLQCVKMLHLDLDSLSSSFTFSLY